MEETWEDWGIGRSVGWMVVVKEVGKYRFFWDKGQSEVVFWKRKIRVVREERLICQLFISAVAWQ